MHSNKISTYVLVKKLSDNDLLDKTKALAKEERSLLRITNAPAKKHIDQIKFLGSKGTAGAGCTTQLPKVAFYLWIGICILSLIPSVSFAEPQEDSAPLRWSTNHSYDGWALLGLAGATAATMMLLDTNTGTGSWSSPVLLDGSVRNALRSPSLSGRNFANSLSDWSRNVMVAAPFVMDIAALQYWRGNDPDGALRSMVVAAQSFALNVFANELVKRIISRERPYLAECGTDPGYNSNCHSVDVYHDAYRDAYRSFYSGHVSMAFTGAGLICLNHSKLNLFNGNTTADQLACAGAVGLASLTGLLRIVADQHYLSDVLVGAGVGFFSGYFFPGFFHSTENAAKTSVNYFVLPMGQDSVAFIQTIRF